MEYVIFDEVHCIRDAESGVFWEHLLLSVPCPYVALSASISNKEEFAMWLLWYSDQYNAAEERMLLKAREEVKDDETVWKRLTARFRRRELRLVSHSLKATETVFGCFCPLLATEKNRELIVDNVGDDCEEVDHEEISSDVEFRTERETAPSINERLPTEGTTPTEQEVST